MYIVDVDVYIHIWKTLNEPSILRELNRNPRIHQQPEQIQPSTRIPFHWQSKCPYASKNSGSTWSPDVRASGNTLRFSAKGFICMAQ